MPYNFDQPDNAERITRLGVGRVISRAGYSSARVAQHLRVLLADPNYARTAAEIGRQVRQEKGAEVAADAIDARLLRAE
jgi:rhamnosyltransferase subunit B